MAILFFLLGLVTSLVGGGMVAVANTEMCRLEGFIVLLIGAVLWSAAGVTETVNRLRREMTATKQASVGKPET